ncbi:hypothetical protein COOONC_18596 [Cooperia oncophora]
MQLGRYELAMGRSLGLKEKVKQMNIYLNVSVGTGRTAEQRSEKRYIAFKCFDELQTSDLPPAVLRLRCSASECRSSAVIQSPQVLRILAHFYRYWQFVCHQYCCRTNAYRCTR